MPDYYTQFSCELDVGSAENAHRALALHAEMAEAVEHDDGDAIGFLVSVTPDDGPGVLWIRDEEGYGDLEQVTAFALRCAEAFNLGGRWGFTWALTCSKPCLDAFDGGARLLDLGSRKSLAWIDGAHWLASMLESAPGADVRHC